MNVSSETMEFAPEVCTYVWLGAEALLEVVPVDAVVARYWCEGEEGLASEDTREEKD